MYKEGGIPQRPKREINWDAKDEGHDAKKGGQSYETKNETNE